MLDVTLEQIIAVVGEPTKVTGHQYYFRCPSCAAAGGDKAGDNLLYNRRKGVLKCFACDEGAKEVLRAIRRQSHSIAPATHAVPKEERQLWWKVNEENLMLYWCQVTDEIPSYVRQWLWDHYGLNQQTIESCGIGYDNDCSLYPIGPALVFPMYALKEGGRLVGFELRTIGKKVIRHTKDCPSSLCHISGSPNAANVIICEGFKDAYTFQQICNDSDFYVLTPSHGCEDIIANLSNLDLTRFKNCYLLLDNDAAGDKVTSKILERHPFFKDKRSLLKGFKDVNDYWRSKCYT